MFASLVAGQWGGDDLDHLHRQIEVRCLQLGWQGVYHLACQMAGLLDDKDKVVDVKRP